MKIKKICRKIWNKGIYYAFPTIYSRILVAMLLVGSLLLYKVYNEEGGQVPKTEELLVTYADSGGNQLEIHLSQEQGSSVWIELYFVFWGLVIAVTGFLLEISGNYKYGLTLKRIVNFSIGSFMTVFAGIFFVLLCPLAYQCESTYRYKTLFVIVVLSFALFSLAIVFLARISMRKYILKLIEKRSRQQILQIRKLFSSVSIPRLNDSLLLRNVIEHTDYSNISEWENMASAIGRCITDKDVKSCLTGTLAEHTLLKAMTKHIIYKSGLESEYVLIQTVDIINKKIDALMKEKKNASNLEAVWYHFRYYYKDLIRTEKEIWYDKDWELKNIINELSHELASDIRANPEMDSIMEAIIEIQQDVQRQVDSMMAGADDEVQIFLESMKRIMKEVVADMSGIMLLENSVYDYLEAFVTSEGEVPDKDTITVELIHRIAMVVTVLTENDYKRWGKDCDNLRIVLDEDCKKGNNKKASDYLNDLWEKVKRFNDQIASGIKEPEKSNTEEGLHADDFFGNLEIIKAEKEYFQKCYEKAAKH